MYVPRFNVGWLVGVVGSEVSARYWECGVGVPKPPVGKEGAPIA